MSDEAPEQLELPEKWKIPKAWADWALEERKGWTLAHVRMSAKKFHEHQRAHRATRPTVELWELAFKKWIRTERDVGPRQEEGKQHQGALCAAPNCTALGSMAQQGGGPWYCSEHFSFSHTEMA